jgi:murein DD-endopeptidase
MGDTMQVQRTPRSLRPLATARPWLACVLAALLVAPTGHTEERIRAAVDLDVPFAPQPVATEDGLRLFYELHLASVSPDVRPPTRVTVLDANDGRRLASFSDVSLSSRLSSSTPVGAAPGDAALVLYVELTVTSQTLPRAITHEVEYAPSNDGTATAKVTGGHALVKALAAPVLGPPLRGGPWASVFHPDWERGHRRVFYAVEGRVCIPGRFAVDWVKLDEDGRLASGDPDVVSNAYAHGNEVLAVADATVVAVRNDFAEVARVSANGRYRPQDASGNFVVLDIGEGRYAFYEHLRPGSVSVKAGQRVQRGDVIAQVGFSGSGNWPHLHFHVGDAPALLGAEGLPFALSRFRVVGAYEDIAALGKSPWTHRADAASAWRENERPTDNAVVWFADEHRPPID